MYGEHGVAPAALRVEHVAGGGAALLAQEELRQRLLLGGNGDQRQAADLGAQRRGTRNGNYLQLWPKGRTGASSCAQAYSCNVIPLPVPSLAQLEHQRFGGLPCPCASRMCCRLHPPAPPCCQRCRGSHPAGRTAARCRSQGTTPAGQGAEKTSLNTRRFNPCNAWSGSSGERPYSGAVDLGRSARAQCQAAARPLAFTPAYSALRLPHLHPAPLPSRQSSTCTRLPCCHMSPGPYTATTCPVRPLLSPASTCILNSRPPTGFHQHLLPLSPFH